VNGVKIIKKMYGKRIVQLHIITGKGNKSKNKFVLKPTIQELCQKLCNEMDLDWKNTEGGVLIDIAV
jgi:NAD(P)H-flavin reductase